MESTLSENSQQQTLYSQIQQNNHGFRYGILHNGLPRKEIKTSYTKTKPEPDFDQPSDLTKHFRYAACPNICSYEFISTQYDHNVQGGTILNRHRQRSLIPHQSQNLCRKAPRIITTRFKSNIFFHRHL